MWYKNNLAKRYIIIFLILFILIGLNFNLIKVFAEESYEINDVYLGGNVIGISINSNGLIITSKIGVITKNGVEYPLKNYDFKEGDILYSIDDVLIKDLKDIDKSIENKDTIKVTIKRNNKYMDFIINPSIDLISNKKKIGLLLQDKVIGIGTITFIDPNNSYFYALGHPIKDLNGTSILDGQGEIYQATINKIIKPKNGKAGELSGVFNTLMGNTGIIEYSDNFGIYGTIDIKYNNLKKISLGHKDEVKEGKAQIYSTISGSEPKYYDILITEVNKQFIREDKSMMIKVIDEDLLSTTGGIVQGMSGSPIVQNGKIIGAVTHVMINEPTIGYGVYIDWMLNK